MKHAEAIRLFADWCLAQPDITGFSVRDQSSYLGGVGDDLELRLDWGDYHAMVRVSDWMLRKSMLGDNLVIHEADVMARKARLAIADQKAKVAKEPLP